MKKLVILVVAVVIFSGIAAQEQSALQMYPVVTYSDETDFSFGGIVFYTHRPEYLKKNLPPNSVYSNVIYSLNQQFIGYLEPVFQLRKGKSSLTLPVKYQKWPSDFYGIGNNTPEDNEEKYTPEIYETGVNYTYRLPGNFSVSSYFKIEKINMLDKVKNGLLANSGLSGIDGGINTGIGFNFVYNTKDSPFYPARGEYISLKVFHSNNKIFSDYTYTKYELDAKKYISLDSKQILAFQHIFTYNAQTPPFQEYAHLGSSMRAYSENRYVDKHKAILRGEYRVFPWEEGFARRLGFVTFVETGQVANHLEQFAISNMKISVGMGVRISLIPSERINLKADYAYAKDSTGINFSGQEAF